MPVYKGRPTKDGRQYYFSVSFKVNGNYKKHNSKMYRTKKEATRAEADFIATFKPGKVTHITINQAIDEYLSDKKVTLKELSYKAAENNFRHIRVNLGNIDIEKMTVADYKAFLGYLIDKGFSAKYCNKIVTYFKAVLNLMNKRYGIVQTLPETFPIFTENAPKEEMQYYTYDEYLRFVSVIEDQRFKALFIFLYGTGCRIGEANGIQMRDIKETENGITIHIAKTLSTKKKNDDGTYYTSKPKTTKSDRYIPLSDEVIEAIRPLINHEYQSYYLFGGVNAIAESTIKKKNVEYAKKAGLKHIRLHDFRHSFVVRCLEKDVPIEVISRYIGHSTITETYNVYSHVTKARQKSLIDTLNK